MKVFRERPILTAFLLVLALAIPGFVRLEMIAQDTQNLIEDRNQQTLERCRASNDSRLTVRETFHSVFDQLELLGADPVVVQQMHDIVPSPETQDLDCDNDGELTERDYGSDVRVELPDDVPTGEG